MAIQSTLNPHLIYGSKQKIQWGAIHPFAMSLALANLASKKPQVIMVLTKNNQNANQLTEELKFYTQNTQSIYRIPDWEILAYERFSPHEDIVSERLATLYQLPQLEQAFVMVPISVALQRLLPQSQLAGHSVCVKVGDILNMVVWQKQLEHAGYQRVSEVLARGEYAIRGSIVDVFPMGNSPTPFRIDCLDNEVNSLRLFDPETQRSYQTTEKINVLLAHEYPLTESAINQFRKNWRFHFRAHTHHSLYQSISAGKPEAGVEFYLPLFYSKMDSLFDYLPAHTTIILPYDLPDLLDHFHQNLEQRYEQLRYDIQSPILKPHQLYLSSDEFYHQLKSFHRIQLNVEVISQKNSHVHFQTQSLPNIAIQHSLHQPLARFLEFMHTFTGRVLLFAQSQGRKEVLCDLLAEASLEAIEHLSWSSFLRADNPLSMMVSPVQRGFIDEVSGLAFIAESDLFGDTPTQTGRKKTTAQDPNLIIRSLTELKIGQPVVHILYGIGSYQGLKRIATGDIDSEYLVIEYAGQDKIYVPIDHLDLINRYIGHDAQHVTLSKLGTKKWEQQKQNTQKRIRDVAAELLVIYSKREATCGFAFNPPNKAFWQFRSAFPFTETPDQTQAIDTVIDDMTSSRCMDRLICGDVGFGKTEVAIQAAFLAFQSGKQVAILVPTTLLATQHMESFRNRLANWPINIAVFSRFSSPKEQQQIRQQLAKGQLDMVIGTHKLLNNELKYKDLGLLIIDEEHRFGVQQKEKIKSLRTQVDILTLTATPIPRSLNMAFSKMRDLSIIATPPEKRLSVKTFVREKQDTLIKEALMREAMRGGQVYYLHNNIETIEAVAKHLRTLAPDAKLAIGHSQMPQRELKRVMLDFYHQRTQILLCTTIIESGIDVPTANTIIIDRADKLGLAQLHQLRGRVGRSHHQAYAYLLVPALHSLKKEALQRLNAISELESLGAGFQLAHHDLEIRGAGELLGEKQSGSIEAMGLTLYTDMLEQAVNALKQGGDSLLENEKPLIEVNCRISALIPESLIGDVNSRLTFYKRLADCSTMADIKEIKTEMIDRFGKLPNETINLIKVTQLKLRAQSMGIKKIEIQQKYGYLHFDPSPRIDFEKMMGLIQTQKDHYQLANSETLRFLVETIEKEQRLNYLHTLLDQMSLK